MDNVKAETVAIPPADILKIQILNRRDSVLTAIEDQEERSIRTGDRETGSHKVKAKIKSFFYALEPALERWTSAEELKAMREDIQGDYQSVKSSFRKINKYLDAKNITKMDTEKAYNSANMEEENDIKGV